MPAAGSPRSRRRSLAGERITTTLLAPELDFVYRPMSVLQPFSRGGAQRYALEEIARDIDADLIKDGCKWLDASRRVVHTEQEAQIEYDALLLALGARPFPRFTMR